MNTLQTVYRGATKFTTLSLGYSVSTLPDKTKTT